MLTVVTKLSTARATEKARTLADDLAGNDGPHRLRRSGALPLYANLRASLDERKVADYVGGTDDATGKLTVKDLLARSPAEAELLSMAPTTTPSSAAPSRPTGAPPSPAPKCWPRAYRRR